MPNPSGPTVKFEPENQRFVIDLGGEEVGYAHYTPIGANTWDFDGTKIDAHYEGRGFGTKLVDTALDHAESEGKDVRGSCWFVDMRIKKRASR